MTLSDLESIVDVLKLTFLAALLIAVGGVALVVVFLRGFRNMDEER